MANQFMWYELMTTDTEAAGKFYGNVVGWNIVDSGMVGPVQYFLLNLPGFGDGHCGVGGMMKLPVGECPSGGEAQPGWTGYIAVDDTDVYAQRIKEKGGAILYGPDDIPQVGRFAVAADPHGAVFMIITPQGPAPAEWPAPGTPGTVGWHELSAGNGEEAFAFYSELFGWQKDVAVPMGEMGDYQLFTAGGPPVGAIMNKMPEIPAPVWTYYFTVSDIESAAARVKENGGQVLMGPQEVPGGSRIVYAQDPQGVYFALVTLGNLDISQEFPGCQAAPQA